MSRVLIIGDTHCPAMHPKYVGFLKGVEKKYNCNRVVHIGDLVDWNAISYHEKDPEMPSAKEEYRRARLQVGRLYRAFPRVDYLMGNHSDLPARKAKTAGLIEDLMMPFKAVWGIEGWNIHRRYADLIIDGVIYRHGDKGKAGARLAAFRNADNMHRSVVQGHLHTQCGFEFGANDDRAFFGMQVGCGVLPNHPNMNYAKVYSNRPILACGVVINGEPTIERMKL